MHGAAIECDFAVTATGDSMVNARILDGDLIFVRSQNDVTDGEIAVVVIDDEALLRRVWHKGGMTLLMPENPAYETIVIDGEACIIGKAIALQGDIL